VKLARHAKRELRPGATSLGHHAPAVFRDLSRQALRGRTRASRRTAVHASDDSTTAKYPPIGTTVYCPVVLDRSALVCH